MDPPFDRVGAAGGLDSDVTPEMLNKIKEDSEIENIKIVTLF